MSEFEPEAYENDFKSIFLLIMKMAAGLILFFASLWFLWKNEGRVDVSALIRSSIPVSAESTNAAAESKLVSVTGEITSDDSLGDPGFLDFGPYVVLNRKVEMYAWVEHAAFEEGRDSKNVSDFIYETEWTDSPADTATFVEPAGHMNPVSSLQSRSYTVKKATVGTYEFAPGGVRMSSALPLALTKKNYIRSLGTHLRGDYLYIGQNITNKPKVGDVRFSYSAIPSGTRGTLFGKLSKDAVEPYVCKNNERIYRLLLGSREEALAQIPPANNIRWILRLAGLIIMWGGLCVGLFPLITISKFVPALEGAKKAKFGALLLLIAVALTWLTLLISSLLPNVYAFGVILAASCVGILFLLARRLYLGPASPAKTSQTNPSAVEDSLEHQLLEMQKEQSDSQEQSVQADHDSKEDSASTPPPSSSSEESRKERTTLPLDDEQIRQSDPDVREEDYAAAAPSPPVYEPQVVTEKKIRIFCERCGLGYTVPASYRGRKVRCCKCDHKFYVKVGSAVEDSKPTVMDTSSEKNH